MGIEPAVRGRHSLGVAHRGSLAGLARRVSQRGDLLAASARWEDEGVWLEAWQQLLAALNHQHLLEWDETFLDGSFVSAKKGALLSEKPSAGRGQSGWYWSMARAFLWERNWRVLHRRKSRSPKRRWQRFESRAGDEVVRGRNRNG